MTKFLLDTSTVSAAMWRVPDPGVLASWFWTRSSGATATGCS